jgi:hypothetical protein
MKEILSTVAIAFISCVALVGLSGCGDAGGAAKTDVPVSVSISNIDNQMYESDVCLEALTGFCTFVSDTNSFTIRVDPISPNEDMDFSRYMDVIITGYQVSFFPERYRNRSSENLYG